MSGVDQSRALKFEKRGAPARWVELTDRERDCMIMAVVGGKTYKEIAHDLGISTSRVKGIMQTAARILGIAIIQNDPSIRTVAFWMGKHAQEIGL